MSPLTPEQEIIKLAVLQEVALWLEDCNPRGLYLLKASQVMRMLDVSPRTLYRLRKSGQLQAKKVASCYRYSYPDILNLIEKRSRP